MSPKKLKPVSQSTEQVSEAKVGNNLAKKGGNTLSESVLLFTIRSE